MSDTKVKYNLEYKGVLCTHADWEAKPYKFYLVYNGKEYVYTQKRYISQSADTDHIRCVIEQFLEDALEALKSVQDETVEKMRTGKSIKAKELAEWLLQHPDFDVSIIENDNPNGWPSYSEYNIELGDIGHSSKIMFIEKGKKIN